MAPRICLYALAALLLGAHFLRGGDMVMVALCLLAPFAFLYRHRWSLILLQIAAYGAAAAWVNTALRLVQMKQQAGRPWTATALILGVVVLFTLLAGLLLNSRVMTQRYPRSSDARGDEPGEAAVKPAAAADPDRPAR